MGDVGWGLWVEGCGLGMWLGGYVLGDGDTGGMGCSAFRHTSTNVVTGTYMKVYSIIIKKTAFVLGIDHFHNSSLSIVMVCHCSFDV